MILILCIDDKGGMAFNRRRQSRDRVQREHLRKIVGQGPLYVSPYTAKLLMPEGWSGELKVSEAYLEEAGEGAFAWCEKNLPEASVQAAERLILYRWGRSYPADEFFPSDRLKQYKMVSRESFSGSSHDEILCEVYELCAI